MTQVLKYYLDQKPLSSSELENLKKSKEKFTDDFFPPNLLSLFSMNKDGFLDQNLGEKIAKTFIEKLKYEPKWIRISDMPELNKLYDEKKFSFETIL